MRKRLPHLDPMIAFEAAARWSSFAKAAEELNISASAVSQQIRSLEQQLGVRLFDRMHRSVVLTKQGRQFHNSVSVALKHLANAADDLKTSPDSERLEVVTDTALALQWLIPRLPEYEARFPDVSLRIRVSDVQSELLETHAPVAIVHGQGSWAGKASELLFAEEIFPVCSPDYVPRNGPITCLQDLAVADLLDLDYEHWHWMNWPIWLTEMELSLPTSPRKLHSNNYPALIEAAKQGSGVALGWKHLLDRDMDNGTLIRPAEGSVKTENGYYVVTQNNDALPGPARAFKDWVLTCR